MLRFAQHDRHFFSAACYVLSRWDGSTEESAAEEEVVAGVRAGVPVQIRDNRLNGQRWPGRCARRGSQSRRLDVLAQPRLQATEAKLSLLVKPDDEIVSFKIAELQPVTIDAEESCGHGDRRALVPIYETMIVRKAFQNCRRFLDHVPVVAGPWPGKRGLNCTRVAPVLIVEVHGPEVDKVEAVLCRFSELLKFRLGVHEYSSHAW